MITMSLYQNTVSCNLHVEVAEASAIFIRHIPDRGNVWCNFIKTQAKIVVDNQKRKYRKRRLVNQLPIMPCIPWLAVILPPKLHTMLNYYQRGCKLRIFNYMPKMGYLVDDKWTINLTLL